MNVEFFWGGGRVSYPADQLPRTGETVVFDGSDPSAPADSFLVLDVIWFVSLRGIRTARVVLTPTSTRKELHDAPA
jgi:hypothetical protein